MQKDLEKVHAVFSAHEAKPIWELRYFSVLALLTDVDGQLHFVLNKRAAAVNQPGDICFPGGHRENGEALMETALRETEEELGIAREDILLLGKSDFMLTVYRGMIQPFLGYISPAVYEKIRPNPAEVAEIFTVPLRFFCETEPERHDTVWQAAQSPDFPYEKIEGGRNYPFSKGRTTQLFYEYDGRIIWGFTAQVIRNIVEILQAAE